MKSIPPGTTNYLVAFNFVQKALGRALTREEKDALVHRYGQWWRTDQLRDIVLTLARSEDRGVENILPVTAAAMRIVELLKRPLTVGENQRLRAWFPQGVPESVLAATAEKLRRPRPELRLVK